MAILTKTEGYFIINEGAISLTESNSVSYRDDATVQEFDTEALMLVKRLLKVITMVYTQSFKHTALPYPFKSIIFQFYKPSVLVS